MNHKFVHMEKMRDVCNMKWFAQEFSHSRTSLNKSTARAVISLFIEMFRLLIMKVKAVKGFIVLAEAGAHWTSWGGTNTQAPVSPRPGSETSSSESPEEASISKGSSAAYVTADIASLFSSA